MKTTLFFLFSIVLSSAAMGDRDIVTGDQHIYTTSVLHQKCRSSDTSYLTCLDRTCRAAAKKGKAEVKRICAREKKSVLKVASGWTLADCDFRDIYPSAKTCQCADQTLFYCYDHPAK